MTTIRGASADRICNAATIPRMTIREMLAEAGELRVPAFQRRFCWGTAQLEALARDVVVQCQRPMRGRGAGARAAGPSGGHGSLLAKHAAAGPWGSRPHASCGGHSLGRVVAAELSGAGAARCHGVIDGQQRATTICILLSSVRDYLAAQGRASELRRDIDAVLFPARSQHDAQQRGRAGENSAGNGGSGPGAATAAGAACVLEVTYFDRPSFARCMRGGAVRAPSDHDASSAAANESSRRPDLGTVGPDDGDHVLLCRAYFDARMRLMLLKIARKLALVDDTPPPPLHAADGPALAPEVEELCARALAEVGVCRAPRASTAADFRAATVTL